MLSVSEWCLTLLSLPQHRNVGFGTTSVPRLYAYIAASKDRDVETSDVLATLAKCDVVSIQYQTWAMIARSLVDRSLTDLFRSSIH